MKPTLRATRWILPLLALFSAAGCAAPTTQLGTLAPGVVEAEEEKQRQLAVRSHVAQQGRLDDVAYPILVNGVPLCQGAVGRLPGFRFMNVHAYEGRWRHAASVALGLGDTLSIVHVTRESAATRAGLKVGDQLLRIAGRTLAPGERGLHEANEYLTSLLQVEADELPITVRRRDLVYDFTLQLDRGCRFPASVVIAGELNASADGKGIYVTSAMMRFTDDEELSVIVAHEFAHNAMGHIRAMNK
ncbi:MAG: M48 family metalloprotease, partial [Gemmatimonadetes bacterium]|nr:M48 family metalloprotease [Gemmatimonadota bacterium]